MGDTFVFANFAVSTLLYELGDSATIMNLITDDAWRFPTNLGGAKVPCVISDDSREPEIVYITQWDAPTGSATIERGREGTTAKNWLAGTLVRHTLTAETFQAIARVTPLGEWQPDLQYVAGNLVLHNDISYIATRANINSEPTGTGNADWQALYIPPGISSEIMSWLGLWTNATTYVQGNVVLWDGVVWVAMTSSMNIEPAWAASAWNAVAPWGGTHRYAPVLTASGSRNYSVSLAPDDVPPALYSGMRLKIQITNDNTPDIPPTPPAAGEPELPPQVVNCTLAIPPLAAWPLRIRPGASTYEHDFKGGEIYEVTFFDNNVNSEWLATVSPEMNRRLTSGESLDAIYKPGIADNVKTVYGVGPTGPTYKSPAQLDWPYPYAERGSLEARLYRIEQALGLYKAATPVTGENKPAWNTTWKPGQAVVGAARPAGSILAHLEALYTSITAHYDEYRTNAIVSLKKLNKETSYTIGPSDTQDVGLGEFIMGLHTDSQGNVINIHAMELWGFHPDGTSEITSGS